MCIQVMFVHTHSYVLSVLCVYVDMTTGKQSNSFDPPRAMVKYGHFPDDKLWNPVTSYLIVTLCTLGKLSLSFSQRSYHFIISICPLGLNPISSDIITNLLHLLNDMIHRFCAAFFIQVHSPFNASFDHLPNCDYISSM